MEKLTLADLHNPRGVVRLYHLKGQYWITATNDGSQSFQEYPGSYELWQVVDGSLMRVQRWLKKSVIGYTGEQLEETPSENEVKIAILKAKGE